MLKIGLPSRGRLAQPALNLFRSSGYTINCHERQFYCEDNNHNVRFFFIHPKDAPYLVSTNYLDLAISAKDIIVEKKIKVLELLPLNFSYCKIVIAVKKDSPIKTWNDFIGKTIATNYPCITAGIFRELSIPIRIVNLSGALEAALLIGIADGIVDCYQTGKSIEINGLRVVESIMESQAILIGGTRTNLSGVITVINNITNTLHFETYVNNFIDLKEVQ